MGRYQLLNLKLTSFLWAVWILICEELWDAYGWKITFWIVNHYCYTWDMCVQELLRLGTVTSSVLCSTEQMTLPNYEFGWFAAVWLDFLSFSLWSFFSPHPFASWIFVCLWRDGTTDVTRTMHFGTPSAYEKVNWHLNVVCDLTFIIRDTYTNS